MSTGTQRPDAPRSGFRRSAFLFVLVLAAFLGGIAFVTAGSDLLDVVTSSQAEAQVAPPVTDEIEAASELGQAFQTVAEAINPAVVQIASARVAERADRFDGNP
ncbi:MAG: hypothetical protein AAF809_10885, partial [Bacteroidota bacterium]